MTKIYLSVIGLLLALSLGLGAYAFYTHTRNGVLKEANKSLTEAAEQAAKRMEKDRQVLAARHAKMLAKGREIMAEKEALENALRANKTWSDTDVPDEVQKALAGPSGGPTTGL